MINRRSMLKLGLAPVAAMLAPAVIAKARPSPSGYNMLCGDHNYDWTSDINSQPTSVEETASAKLEWRAIPGAFCYAVNLKIRGVGERHIVHGTSMVFEAPKTARIHLLVEAIMHDGRSFPINASWDSHHA